MYFAVNLGRSNLPANISAIAQSEGIAKNALGLMATLFFISYGSGQFLCGIIAEHLNAAALISTGAVLACIANFTTAWADSVRIMQICWMVNGMGQSLIWISMTKILSEYLSEQQCINACVHIGITGPLAAFCIYGLSSLLLIGSGWRMVFFISGVFILLAVILWILIIPYILKSEKNEAVNKEKIHFKNNPGRKKIKTGYSLILVGSASGLGWLIGISCIQGVLKDGLNTWVPTYLVDTFRISPSFSAALSMILPVCSIVGIYLSRFVAKNYLKNEADSAILFLAVTLAALLMLWLFPGSILLTLILFFLVTTMIIALNTLLLTIMPFHYAYTGRIPLIIGLLNTSAYLGSGIAGYSFGHIAESANWGIIRIIWCGTSLSAIGMCFIIRRRWSLFCKKRTLTVSA
jgi:OPA family glycerol-3-phosphate transporter-like MFS transporter